MIDLEAIKLVIFDADGTLRRCTVPGYHVPTQSSEWQLLPNVRERVRLIYLLSAERLAFGIVSNQSYVSSGEISLGMAGDLLCELIDALQPVTPGARWRIALCPHAIESTCPCRKPQPGMLLQLMGQALALPSETLYVGDREVDQEAAKRAGAHFMWAWDFFDRPRNAS